MGRETALYFKSSIEVSKEFCNTESKEDMFKFLKMMYKTQTISYFVKNNGIIINICVRVDKEKIYILSVVDIKKCLFEFTINKLISWIEEYLGDKIEYIKPASRIEINEMSQSEFISELRSNIYSLDNEALLKFNDYQMLQLTDGIERFNGFEKVVNKTKTDLEIQTMIKHEPYYSSISKEIKRIDSHDYKDINSVRFLGHPVHYMVDIEFSDDIINVLVNKLEKNNRIVSCTVNNIIIDSNLDRNDIKYCYQYGVGGTVVVKLTGDVSNSNMITLSSGNNITTYRDIMEQANKYKHEVLTILVIPFNSPSLIKTIKDMAEMPFVEIKNKNLSSSEAKSYLNKLVQTKGIKKFPGTLTKDKSYTYSDLKELFNNWFESYLKTVAFKEYNKKEFSIKPNKNKLVKGAANKQLDEMIGLSEIKTIINQIISYFKMQKIYKEKGISVETPCRHMIFSGNPGTAKTTVARLLGQILKDNDIISTGRVFELGRSDLVEKYVGWTAKNVKDKISEAAGGILFIDEAYSLVDDKSGMFGDEAINTLVQEMDNVRENTIIILAGYPDKMEDFINTNPGIRSRIGFHVKFPNYDEDELIQILKNLANSKNIRLDEDAISKARIEISKNIGTKDFGNGRFIRGLLEKSIMQQSVRLVENEVFDQEEITTIRKEDITPMSQGCKEVRIGFGV